MNEKVLKWLKAAGIRAIKTFAQAFIAHIGVATALNEVAWEKTVSVAVLAAILSILTSLSGLPEVE